MNIADAANTFLYARQECWDEEIMKPSLLWKPLQMMYKNSYTERPVEACCPADHHRTRTLLPEEWNYLYKTKLYPSVNQLIRINLLVKIVIQ